VYVSIAPRVVPLPGRVASDVAAALRRAMPLTTGQIVAWQLARGATSGAELDAAAAEWIDRSRADRRPVAPSLLGAERSAALRGAHRRALQHGVSNPIIGRLAAELEDAQAR
jgi:hypothetical protein